MSAVGAGVDVSLCMCDSGGYTATKIPFKHSFSGNCAALVLISTFMCFWALYIPRIDPHIFQQQIRQIDCGNILIAHRHMNVEIGTMAAQFLFCEYLFRIFGIVSLRWQLQANRCTAKCKPVLYAYLIFCVSWRAVGRVRSGSVGGSPAPPSGRRRAGAPALSLAA